MEDAERFDPVKGLSTRVLARLEDAPELDLDEAELPAPGEHIRVFYPPDDYAKLAKRKYVIESEVFEVVQWYRLEEGGPIVAFIGRETRAPHSIEVLYGTDWTPDETVALKAAKGLIRFRTRQLLETLDELDEFTKAFDARLEKVETDRELAKAERAEALEEGRALDVLLVERSDPTDDEKRVTFQARTRALDLMADKDIRVEVSNDKYAVKMDFHKKFGALMLVEHIYDEVEDPEDRYPILSPAQAQLVDDFLEAAKPVWVWRDSQGVKVKGHVAGKHDRGDGECVTVAVIVDNPKE